jgi:MarR family transcriptional regulator, negative regulator of the multidrug operon emrRAB
MTSLLDTLERRRLIERHPHPIDRRKVLIHLTDQGRVIVDRMLPVVHAASTEAFASLAERDRQRLVDLLSAVRAQLVDLSDSAPVEPEPRRRTRR